MVTENLGAELVRLNTARMEAAKERQSFADKKAFKVCVSPLSVVACPD